MIKIGWALRKAKIMLTAKIASETQKGVPPNTASEKPAGKKKFQITRKEIIAALICCIVDFGIAQFGLLTLIQKAYSFLAYLAIPVILVPYIIHMTATRFDTKN